MGDEQAQFKKEIKQWLKLQGLGYSWLAEQCGVSEITVRNWMSQKNIPPLKQQLLEKVMVQIPGVAKPSAPELVDGVSVSTGFTLTVQLEPSVYSRLTTRALAENTTVEQLVAGAITSAADDSRSPALRNRKVILPHS